MLIVLETVVVLLKIHPVIVLAVIFVQVSAAMAVADVADHVHMIAQVTVIAVVKMIVMAVVVVALLIAQVVAQQLVPEHVLDHVLMTVQVLA